VNLCLRLRVGEIPATVCLTAHKLVDGVPAGEFVLTSPSGGNPSGGVGEHGLRVGGNPNSRVCLTARRLADGVPVGRFMLTSPSVKIPTAERVNNVGLRVGEILAA